MDELRFTQGVQTIQRKTRAFLNRRLGIFWFICLNLSAACCFAHQGSTAYLTLNISEQTLLGRWEIPVADLDAALGLDANHDQKVTEAEMEPRLSEVATFALSQLKVHLDGIECVLVLTNSKPQVREFSDGASLALDFATTNLNTSPHLLKVEYHFMFDRKPLDRAFLQIDCRGVTQTSVFSAQDTTQQFDLTVQKPRTELRAFLHHGIAHIWGGYDHILFLLSLLLPAVMRFEKKRWHAAPGLREAMLNVVKVVTAFTLAHSITLSLAALEIVRLPSRWVESTIAASVIVAAANNLRPIFTKSIWMVAFIFGLVHGFGFASVLTEYSLPARELVMGLVGFNVGVELGQLAIVVIFLPVAYWASRFRFYPKYIVPGGSVCIVMIAGVWLFERLFEMRVLGF